MQGALRSWQLQMPTSPLHLSPTPCSGIVELGSHTASLTLTCSAASCFPAFVPAVPSALHTLPIHPAC